ncbi:glutamine synthetase family protein [Demequina sp. TTPB684]|uniref:glutamine synthetase family protein n=1 Tax=unclassified Demequina TaxID=2620311 RepID=UPI001CF5B25C|nr:MULTISPECIES: glutamine synthetase family protein [unclassified Demequina]MCB2414015.1 glutamine synthetase family protein [Demequina sp. TTPB684]UPU89104.1 glutamine synthetase family protein [Demequina sp. TMPB413]
MDKQQEYVLRSVEERDIRFIRLWFTDVLGILKSVAIAPAELENAFSEGIGFDGSAVEGLTRVYESDMLAKPDPTTYQVLPWRGERQGAARMFCDIGLPDGEPALSDPRQVLKRTLDKASEQGFSFYIHPEIEFYLFKPLEEGQPPKPVDQAGYFDNVPRGTAHEFRRTAITTLEEMGISVEFSHHEAGPGQNEIDLRYADALTAADNIMTFRTAIKEVALEQGLYASFMPKPLHYAPGSGMHTHLSLFEGDRNAFHDPAAELGLSPVARQFMAGLLRHAPEITAVTNQYVNSYKRLWGGAEAPSYVCWGSNNRSALVRVPIHKPSKGQSTRVEYRAVDSAANPYLAFSVMLAAGLKGIEEGYELPPGAEDDVWELSAAERKTMGYEPLPSSLSEAVAVMEKSELVAETLGENVFDFFLRNKREEWSGYRAQVTPFELERHLGVL